MESIASRIQPIRPDCYTDTPFFRTEQRRYDEAVTGWERARYFERG